MAFQQYPIKAGIPSGVTAARPASPVTGDTYYDGTLGFLLIWEGTQWIPCSAPAAQPSIAVADVGTSRAWNNPAATITFTEGASGGKAAGFTAIQGSFSGTSTSNPIVLAITGTNGNYSFTGTAYNGFGTSPQALTVSQTLTTVPDAPTSTTASVPNLTTDALVSWTAPSTGGKTITGYTITPLLSGTTAQTASTTTSTSITISGLTQGSSYTFKVKATNANGTGVDGTASGSITIPTTISVDYLVIAGGGGGSSGGGGAGGYRTSAGTSGGGSSAESALTIVKGTNYTVTIGAGGANAAVSVSNASSGEPSVFATITSNKGGGGGGINQDVTSGTYGSGGGGGSDSTAQRNGTSGTANQGYAGGINSSNRGTPYPAGGGGGAGSVGQDGSGTSVAGNGGSGVASTITGSSVTRAGGGGGGVYGGGGSGGAAGSGGGGTGGVSSNSSAGTNASGNTGSGGGGGASNATTNGNGGSGLVVLRWLTSAGTITVGAGLTADSTGTDGSYSYKRITAGTGNVSFA